MLGLGLNILTGFTGLLNLGVAAFMAVGAYSYAILTCDIYPFRLGFWPATIITVLVGLTVGTLPWPAHDSSSRRLSGHRDTRVRRNRRRRAQEPRFDHKRHPGHQSPALAFALRLSVPSRNVSTVVLPLPRLPRASRLDKPQSAPLPRRPRVDLHPRRRTRLLLHGHQPDENETSRVRPRRRAMQSRRARSGRVISGPAASRAITIFRFPSSRCAW